MTLHSRPQPTASSGTASPAAPDPAEASRRIRSVHRAVSDLRRGLPIVLTGNRRLVVLAAETACAGGLATFRQAPSGGILLLAPTRAAAVLGRPVPDGAAVAVALPADAWQPDILASLADATLPQPGLPAPLGIAPTPALGPAAIALAKLALLLPALLAAECPDTEGLLEVAGEDVLAYPVEAASHLVRVAAARVPLAVAADTRVVAFRPADGGPEHLAICIGEPKAADAPLVRIHSECFTGDLLGSLRCDCGPQLHQALARMAAEGAGVVLYMAQEGRGIGLANKLRAYALQDRGLDTLDANRALGWAADERNFLAAATMLRALGIGRIRLLTNNPDKLAAMAACGVEVTGRVSHAIAANGVNDAYLETKLRRFGHLPA